MPRLPSSSLWRALAALDGTAPPPSTRRMPSTAAAAGQTHFSICVHRQHCASTARRRRAGETRASHGHCRCFRFSPRVPAPVGSLRAAAAGADTPSPRPSPRASTTRGHNGTNTTPNGLELAGAPVRGLYERAGGQQRAIAGSVVVTGKVLSRMAGTVYAVQLDAPGGRRPASTAAKRTGNAVHLEATAPAAPPTVASWPSTAREDPIHDDDDAFPRVPLALSPIVGVGSRVFIEYGLTAQDATSAHSGNQPESAEPSAPRQLVGGVVARINANRTVAVLLDDNNLDLAVPQASIRLNISRGSYIDHKEHTSMMGWLRAAGVPRRSDREFLSAVLHLRGWTTGRLYLLEASDLHVIPLISKSVRLCVLEKAEWERDHHKQMRQLLKERVKERDFRYRITKYSGVISASMAFLGIAVAFAWNAMNFHRQQRTYQLRLAVDTLTTLFERAESTTTSHTTTAGLREVQKRPTDASSMPSSAQETTPSPPPTHIATLVDAEPMSGGEATPVTPFARMVRPEEESTLRRVLRLLDVNHPRVVVVTGVYGSGKKTLCQHCVEAEKVPALYVDVRESEDTLRSIVRALGVENVDVCGDLLDLVAEACQTASRQWSVHHPPNTHATAATTSGSPTTTGTAVAEQAAPVTATTARTTTSVLSLSTSSSTAFLAPSSHEAAGPAESTTSNTPGATHTQVPLIVLKLHHAASLKKVYNEAVALACDRRVCHLVVLLPLESLTMANLTMPRLDFYMVPIFNQSQAFQYTQHAIDPISLSHFVQTVGTNGNDLDELFAAVHQRQLTACEHTTLTLQRAVHQLSEACNGAEPLQKAVLQLALLPFDEGQHTAVATSGLLRHPSLGRIVLYDPVKDAWVFRSRVYHTAARCLWQTAEHQE